LSVTRAGGLKIENYTFESQRHVELRMPIASRARNTDRITLLVTEQMPDPATLRGPDWESKLSNETYALFAPAWTW
jgi:hypothetical protein